MKAIVMDGPGGPEMLRLAEHDEPVAGPGDVLVEVDAAGVNFMDIGVRRGGIWSTMPNPKTPGVEGAGRVLSVGANVADLRPGQRVAWVYAPGSYAQRIAIPAASLVPIPDAIDHTTAAAVMMQGLTASHFATDFYPVRHGDIALVHAAAGGLGLLLTQIIRLRGGMVIGRVSHEDKIEAARHAGADHVIVDSEGRFADDVMRLTDGEGVHVVYDGSGPATFQGSLASLRRSGTFCWYGPRAGRCGADPHHEPAEEHQARLRDLRRSHPYACPAARKDEATVRRDHCGRAGSEDWRRVSASGRSTGACRYGESPDDREVAAGALSKARRHPRTQRKRWRSALR
jgi:NADPH2:quinone reductase